MYSQYTYKTTEELQKSYDLVRMIILCLYRSARTTVEIMEYVNRILADVRISYTETENLLKHMSQEGYIIHTNAGPANPHQMGFYSGYQRWTLKSEEVFVAEFPPTCPIAS